MLQIITIENIQTAGIGPTIENLWGCHISWKFIEFVQIPCSRNIFVNHVIPPTAWGWGSLTEVNLNFSFKCPLCSAAMNMTQTKDSSHCWLHIWRLYSYWSRSGHIHLFVGQCRIIGLKLQGHEPGALGLTKNTHCVNEYILCPLFFVWCIFHIPFKL